MVNIINKKIRLLVIIIIFVIFIGNSFAALCGQFVINDKLKQCKIYTPHPKYDLPEGWKVYIGCISNIDDYKKTCESLGYTYVDEVLPGIEKEYYTTIVPILNTLLNIIFIITLGISYSLIIIKFIKIKEKNYLKLICSLIFTLILIIIIYEILKFLIDPKLFYELS